ncbi:MAG: TetR/AcrR family transcriptional regulator [Alphaproteobacteria bacterium]|nr:TetR/AcrR family transcriptional regulator [Alphaproteobacteria bacterium]
MARKPARRRKARSHDRTRRRLAPDERERLIAQAAVYFFAEQGFEGQTRELARRLGIAQPLLYRYFPSKHALIERVYREVFVDPWQDEWFVALADRSRPLKERLTYFYQVYARTAVGYERVRLFILAGLRGLDLNARFFKMLRERVFAAVVREVRHANGLPPLETVPMSETEAELVWMLHAAIFYIGIRRWIYGLPVPDNIDAVIEGMIATFLEGIPKEMAVLTGAPPA